MVRQVHEKFINVKVIPHIVSEVVGQVLNRKLLLVDRKDQLQVVFNVDLVEWKSLLERNYFVLDSREPLDDLRSHTLRYIRLNIVQGVRVEIRLHVRVQHIRFKITVKLFLRLRFSDVLLSLGLLNFKVFKDTVMVFQLYGD